MTPFEIQTAKEKPLVAPRSNKNGRLKLERNQAVLDAITAKEGTYAQIGKRFGMSKSAVQGVFYRAVEASKK